jgi:hypothetical protein
MRLFALLAVFLVSDSRPRQSQNPYSDMSTGNGLLEICAQFDKDSSSFGLYDNGTCLGYIEGVLKGATLPKGECTATATNWCVPSDVTLGQIKDVVVKSLRDHPENRQRPSQILIVNAVLKAWPCRTQ